jgi:hypothetical protein
MPPRRFTTFVFVVAVSLTALFIFSSSTRQIASQAVDAVPNPLPEGYRPKLPSFEVPDFKISWHKSAHKPPEQKNSTSGGSSWYSDWRWLNPFSSSVTLDEDRAVLPPFPERPPVYTYYETTSKKDEETIKADKALLLTWRQAWWAKGFKPIILSEAEAMNNPLYLGLHAKGMPTPLESEFMRWLALLSHGFLRRPAPLASTTRPIRTPDQIRGNRSRPLRWRPVPNQRRTRRSTERCSAELLQEYCRGHQRRTFQS